MHAPSQNQTEPHWKGNAQRHSRSNRSTHAHLQRRCGGLGYAIKGTLGLRIEQVERLEDLDTRVVIVVYDSKSS